MSIVVKPQNFEPMKLYDFTVYQTTPWVASQYLYETTPWVSSQFLIYEPTPWVAKVQLTDDTLIGEV